MKIKKLLKDPKHWVGWLLTAVVLSFFLRLFGLMRDRVIVQIITGIVILIVIVGVDLFKHKVGLQ